MSVWPRLSALDVLDTIIAEHKLECEVVEARDAFADAIAALKHARSTLATALRCSAPDMFATDEDVNEHLAIRRIDSALARAEGRAA